MYVQTNGFDDPLADPIYSRAIPPSQRNGYPPTKPRPAYTQFSPPAPTLTSIPPAAAQPATTSATPTSVADRDPYVAKLFIPDDDNIVEQRPSRNRNRAPATPMVSTELRAPSALAAAVMNGSSTGLNTYGGAIPAYSIDKIRMIHNLQFPPGFESGNRLARSSSEFGTLQSRNLPIQSPRDHVDYGSGSGSGSNFGTASSAGQNGKHTSRSRGTYYDQMRLHNATRTVQGSTDRNEPEFGDQADCEIGFRRKKKLANDPLTPNTPYTVSRAKRGTITSLPTGGNYDTTGCQPLFSNARHFHAQYANRSQATAMAASDYPPNINPNFSMNARPISLGSYGPSATANPPGSTRDIRSYAFSNTKMFDSRGQPDEGRPPTALNSFTHNGQLLSNTSVGSG